GERERALGKGLRDRGSARRARVGLCGASCRPPRLGHRPGQRPLAATRRAAGRDPRRDREPVRRRAARPLAAPAMITTERLILRKPRAEDAQDLAVAYADPEVIRFMGDGSTATPEEVAEGIE